MKDYFSVGKIVATYGLAGEVVLAHALGKQTDLKGLETIFVEERKDSFLPYFVESTKLKNHTEVYLKLEGFNSKESARRMIQKEVWLLKTDFNKFAGSASPISLLGYTMINEGKPIGEVIEVIEQPMQVLCKVMINGVEALIPIHGESLLKIDKKKLQVHVQLPDGLLEIYTNP
ncbi:16S rRNA processing protein RimM [Segetibacter sp. 3557_3]|uniref:ribosome maturation factor RimM n=1 Tax=Segetibacter sp. 3557_3 TaxID=2547429 RepID=UPI0010587299|nr:ribosome maturation factor RimM [Segetibacter sp. 3557_3]TDH25538.1 16S rRNA processing protein RimM [Segetibacter sp. 3557_3]